MRVTYLVKRWKHHTASGGYDRLAQEVEGEIVQRREVRSVAARIARSLWRNLSRPKEHLIDYQFQDWLAEWRLVAKTYIESPDVVHVLYGDEQLDVLLHHRRLIRCPLVASFHLPSSRVKERFESVQKHLLARLDLAVVVSRSQMSDYKRWFGAEKVVYVPHGIDTSRFCPDNHKVDRGLKLIAVGSTMRDWTALHQIIDECRIRKLPIDFDVVAPSDCEPYLVGCTNARLHVGISEEKLIEMYREAGALLAPMCDATANNGVLEALACGTPVISNMVGGIPDYVDDASGWLFEPGEVAAIVELLSSSVRNRDILLSRRIGARKKSLEFSWERIVAQMRTVYDAVVLSHRR
jgi:glycosyltransferase involved in cell wall biosynthesis